MAADVEEQTPAEKMMGRTIVVRSLRTSQLLRAEPFPALPWTGSSSFTIRQSMNELRVSGLGGKLAILDYFRLRMDAMNERSLAQQYGQIYCF